jgi:hypothetical protein
MADTQAPTTDAPATTGIDLSANKKAKAPEPAAPPAAAEDAKPSGRIIEERTVRDGESLALIRQEAVDAVTKRAQEQGLSSFTCEYTELSSTTFQVEAKRIG